MHTNAASLCPEFPAIAQQGRVMKPKTPDADVASSGHFKEASLRLETVLAGFHSRAFMGRQAPLSGAPHSVPPSPLQTTASCRQTVQNPTP
jgi:hypothetical protein